MRFSAQVSTEELANFLASARWRAIPAFTSSSDEWPSSEHSQGGLRIGGAIRLRGGHPGDHAVAEILASAGEWFRFDHSRCLGKSGGKPFSVGISSGSRSSSIVLILGLIDSASRMQLWLALHSFGD